MPIFDRGGIGQTALQTAMQEIERANPDTLFRVFLWPNF
jgi:hypothetical protein